MSTLVSKDRRCVVSFFLLLGGTSLFLGVVPPVHFIGVLLTPVTSTSDSSSMTQSKTNSYFVLDVFILYKYIPNLHFFGIFGLNSGDICFEYSISCNSLSDIICYKQHAAYTPHTCGASGPCRNFTIHAYHYKENKVEH